MSGFACIPAVVLFGLDPLAGKGLIFQSLPKIFSTLSGGMIFFFLFMLAIFFAGLPTCISLVEVPSPAWSTPSAGAARRPFGL